MTNTNLPELPEPYLLGGLGEHNFYTADQMHAYALAALAQSGQGEAVYQYQKADGSWIDQDKSSYDYNVKRGSATVRVLYTRPQPAQPPENSNEDFLDDVYKQCCALIKPLVDAGKLPGSLVESLQILVSREAQPTVGTPEAMKIVIEAMRVDPDYAWSWHCNVAMAFVDEGGEPVLAINAAARFMRLLANVEPAHELPAREEAQPARVVGTVTGYQTASGAQQWQFNPSNVAGLENQRFDVALSTPTAAPTPGSITSMQHPMNPGGFQDCGFGPTWHDYAAAPTPSQAAVTELKRWFMNPETGMLVQTERGPWVRYVDVIEALAAYAKKEGAGMTEGQYCYQMLAELRRSYELDAMPYLDRLARIKT